MYLVSFWLEIRNEKHSSLVLPYDLSALKSTVFDPEIQTSPKDAKGWVRCVGRGEEKKKGERGKEEREREKRKEIM